MVYARALHILGNSADAQEATQEVFIRAMKAMGKFEGRSQVHTWLHSITTNYCLNQIRNWKRRRELLQEQGGVAAGSGQADERPRADRVVLVRQLLAEADEDQAKAAWYVHVDGMSHAEAAQRLNVSKRTVGNLLERFRARAQERLAQGHGGDDA